MSPSVGSTATSKPTPPQEGSSGFCALRLTDMVGQKPTDTTRGSSKSGVKRPSHMSARPTPLCLIEHQLPIGTRTFRLSRKMSVEWQAV